MDVELPFEEADFDETADFEGVEKQVNVFSEDDHVHRVSRALWDSNRSFWCECLPNWKFRSEVWRQLGNMASVGIVG